MADGRKDNGGARKGSGRKPDPDRQAVLRIKKDISDFADGIDPVTKKRRSLVLLEILFKEGCCGNVVAIKEFFDRAVGKAKENKKVDAKFSIQDLSGLPTSEIEKRLNVTKQYEGIDEVSS